ncbi:MBL fold metallo-hydrolase [Myxococcota bacterium]|nr:MBL fold metallo-hydrolase [Myxococcota bacterium]
MSSEKAPFEELAGAITLIDTGFMREQGTAVYLLQSEGRYAIIETGVANSTRRIIQTLNDKNISLADVDYVIVTHVHLDHAGGAGTLLARLPNAHLVVHPRGARHMVDPSKLWAGAAAVYSEEALKRNFGEMLPVPARQILEAPLNGESIKFGARELTFFDVQGHAKHHVAIYDEQTQGVFTGDTFGLAYPELCGPTQRLVFPTTTPIQFDPDEMRKSIQNILSYHPQRLYLTHYGVVNAPQKVGDELLSMLDAVVKMAKAEINTANRHIALRDGFLQIVLDELEHFECHRSKEKLLESLAPDAELNAQGLDFWLDTLKN